MGTMLQLMLLTLNPKGSNQAVQTLCYAASHPGPHCWYMSHLWDALLNELDEHDVITSVDITLTHKAHL